MPSENFIKFINHLKTEGEKLFIFMEKSKVVDDDKILLIYSYPPKEIEILGVPPFTIDLITKHHGLNPEKNNKLFYIILLLLTGASGTYSFNSLKLLKDLNEEKITKIDNNKKQGITRREFLNLAGVLASLGISLGLTGTVFSALYTKNSMGKSVALATEVKGYNTHKSALSELNFIKAFILFFQKDIKKETIHHPTNSISIDFETTEILHEEKGNYTIKGVPITWQDKSSLEDNEVYQDTLYIYEPPKDQSFVLQLSSALSHRDDDGKQVVSFQIPTALKQTLKKLGLTSSLQSYNRYNRAPYGLESVFKTKSVSDVSSSLYQEPKNINPMHSGSLFLSYSKRINGKLIPLIMCNPSWQGKEFMGWSNVVTAERDIDLIEFICMSNKYACWSPDMISEYKALNKENKDKFLKLFLSKLTDKWSGVPEESFYHNAYHTVLTIDKAGNLKIKKDSTLAEEIKQTDDNELLEEYLANNHIIKPVSLINLNTDDDIPTREDDPTDIAINFSIIKDEKCIGIITADQLRRVNMNQLRKIAQLWLDNKGISYKNAYLVGMDEHGGGEIVNATDIKPLV